MRILVVDDEADLLDALSRGLRREGYAVDTANDGEEALAKASWTPYDLICLDLTLQGIDGLEGCARLRAEPPGGVMPRILMLTARDTLEDRIRGLDVGADDYLVKPFAFDELTARIRTLLRRDSGRSGAVLEVGDVVVDTARHHASRAGRDLGLTAKEFAVLRYFMSRPITSATRTSCPVLDAPITADRSSSEARVAFMRRPASTEASSSASKAGSNSSSSVTRSPSSDNR